MKRGLQKILVLGARALSRLIRYLWGSSIKFSTFDYSATLPSLYNTKFCILRFLSPFRAFVQRGKWTIEGIAVIVYCRTMLSGNNKSFYLLKSEVKAFQISSKTLPLVSIDSVIAEMLAWLLTPNQ